MQLQSSLIWGSVFLWLLSFWPAAHFVASNFEEIAFYKFDGISKILLVSAIVPSVASAIGLLLWTLRRYRAALFILCGFASWNLLLFCYGAIQALLVKLWAAAGIPHGVSAFYVLLCLTAFWAFGLGLRTLTAKKTAALIALAVFGFNIVSAIHSSFAMISNSTPKPAAVTDLLPADRSVIRENIYYVLLDSYPGATSSGKLLGYDNPLSAQLDRRGFFSSGDFKTAYFATFLTMSSVLDANYSVTETSSFPLDKANFYPIRLHDGYVPAAIKAFQATGFKTYFLGNWYARCANQVFVCLDDLKIKQSIAFGTFIGETPVARFFPAVVGNQADPVPPFDVLYDAIAPLQKNIKRLSGMRENFFVFAHNMAPHPPTDYNPDCSRAPGRQTVNLNWSGRKENYVSALKCVNAKILALLDEIDKYDPQALVVLQSDHGSFTELSGSLQWDNISPSLLNEMSYPINFIRAPQECQSWLYKGMAQVNTMRFMLGCAMRRKPNYLSDDTYIGRGRRDVDGPFVLLDRRQPYENN